MLRSILPLIFFYLGLFNGVHGSYWQQKVDYDIQVKLDDTSHQLHGFESITYHNRSQTTLNVLYFHLWPNAYSSKNTPFAKQKLQNGSKSFAQANESEMGQLDSLNFKANGEKLYYQFEDEFQEICKVALKEPLKPGDSITVTTPFRVKIPGNFSRMGRDGQSYQITQWYPKVAMYDENGWHTFSYLNQGEFYNNFGDYDVEITLPENYVVGATGQLQTPSEIEWLQKKDSATRQQMPFEADDQTLPTPSSSDQMKTLHYTQQNVPDFAWFTDKNYNVLMDTVQIPRSDSFITSYSMFNDAYAPSFQNSPQKIRQAIQYFSRKVGAYPYETYTVVNGALKTGGGMEYPTITVVSDKNPEVTILHEIGHSWFQCILAFNERKYPWLDEGLTTFYQNRYYREKQDESMLTGMEELDFDLFNMDAIYDYVVQHQEQVALDQPVQEHSTQFTSINYFAMVYAKAPRLLRYLYEYKGTSVFDSVMHHFYDQWKFRHPDPEDLHKTFESYFKKDFDWFFDDLIQSRKSVDYGIDGKVKGTADQLVIYNNTGVRAPVLMKVYKDTAVKHQQWIHGFEGTKKVTIPTDDYTKAVINPRKIVPESNYKNNYHYATGIKNVIKPIDLRSFIGIDQPDKNDLFVNPALGFNKGDGFMLGGVVSNSLLPPQNLEYSFIPLYGFESQRLAGIGKFSSNFYYQTDQAWHNLELGIKGKRFTYDRDPLLTYNKFEPYLHFQLKPKPFRKNWKHHFKLRSANVWREQEEFKLFEEDLVKENRVYHVNEFKYKLERQHQLTPFSTELTFQQNNYFVKTFAEVKGKLPYWNNESFLKWRVFGGYFPDYDESMAEFKVAPTFRYGSRMKRFEDDYMYDELLVSRTGTGNIWAQQTYKSNGNFKVISGIGGTSDWLTAVNLQTPIHPDVPFRIFGDFGTNANSWDGSEFGEEVKVAYDAGFALVLAEDFFEVYYPFLYSDNFNSYFDNNDWHEAILFRLNLKSINFMQIRKDLQGLMSN